jgi:hypothetical protein
MSTRHLHNSSATQEVITAFVLRDCGIRDGMCFWCVGVGMQVFCKFVIQMPRWVETTALSLEVLAR